MKNHHDKAMPLTLALMTAIIATPASSAEQASTILRSDGAAGRAFGDPVTPDAKPIVNRLGAPDTSRVRAETASQIKNVTPGFAFGFGGAPSTGTRAFGSFGLPYTSTRVQSSQSNQSATNGNYLSSTAPYRFIGKLFMNGGYCSASLIRRSVIVTAAHCIQNYGSGNNIFGGWIFIPGYYGPGATQSQREPYGRWNWTLLTRPTVWVNGNDTCSGSACNNDLAVIILAKNASNQFIGDVLGGWLGYGWNNYSFVSSAKTANLAVAATSTLGYPGLMDSGNIMQRADGPSYLTTINGALQIWQGNNFTGGSSGGPWIVNFVSFNPTLSGGAAIGTAYGRAVVGVTSWGSADPNGIKDNYSSRFGQNPQFPNAAYGTYGAGNIGRLLNDACSQPVSPGGPTYAASGYCN